MCHHPQLLFVFFVETGFCHVAQGSLEFLGSTDLPTLASQSAGITGVNHPPRLAPSFHKTAMKMFDIKAWAEYVVEWAAKDPYGFLTTVILALTPLLLASVILSWKLAKMIEARGKEQKKKQNVKKTCKSETTEKGLKD